MIEKRQQAEPVASAPAATDPQPTKRPLSDASKAARLCNKLDKLAVEEAARLCNKLDKLAVEEAAELARSPAQIRERFDAKRAIVIAEECEIVVAMAKRLRDGAQ